MKILVGIFLFYSGMLLGSQDQIIIMYHVTLFIYKSNQTLTHTLKLFRLHYFMLICMYEE